tara:strand:- start:478 stop:876 length:399 start_codon:yes stop_codon:yes gene_type:complete
MIENNLTRRDLGKVLFAVASAGIVSACTNTVKRVTRMVDSGNEVTYGFLDDSIVYTMTKETSLVMENLFKIVEKMQDDPNKKLTEKQRLGYFFQADKGTKDLYIELKEAENIYTKNRIELTRKMIEKQNNLQ